MTLSLDVRPARASTLQPRYLNRAQPLNAGEKVVARWLRELSLEPLHERWFYPFWIDSLDRPHGFRLDFTFTFMGRLMGLEVCEAGRYPTPHGCTNPTKWRPPEVKLQDKRDKIARLAEIHGVSCALVTDVEIDAWKTFAPRDRSQALYQHLLTAASVLVVPRLAS